MYKFHMAFFLAAALTGCNAMQNVTKSQQNNIETIPVELTTHLGYRQQFIEGEELQFLLSLGSDAYIYMFHIDTDGQLTQLLPDSRQQSNFYRAGYFITIPEYRDTYRFVVDHISGQEFIWVFASDQSTMLDKNTKDIMKIKTQIEQGARSAYGEYVFVFDTVSKTTR